MARIEHFAIYAAVDEVAALKDFYLDAFAMRVAIDNGAGDPPGYFLVDDAGLALELIGRPVASAAVNPRWAYHLAFWTDDFSATEAALATRGIVFETETRVDSDDLKTSFFLDPAGNRCQIVWRKKRIKL